MVDQKLTKSFLSLKNDWDVAAVTQYYRDYIAQGFNEEEAFRISGEANTKWIEGFLASYNVSWNNKVVTELGCGAGRMTEFIAKNARHVNAVDISAEMLHRLNQRLRIVPNVSTHCIIRDFSILTDLETDIIISFLVFQHTPEDMVERLIQDGRRILKDGGYYFFQIPLMKTHTCVPCNDAHALDMVYWTLDEVKSLADKYRFKIIAAPTDTKSQFFLFQKHG